jgi:hypothetical protein
MKKITLLLCALLLFASTGIYAQVASTYGFTQSTATYAEITGGTVLGATDNDDEVFNNSTDQDSPETNTGFPIGFNFIYNGASFDKFAVSANGWIKLGTGSFTINGSSSPLSSSTASIVNVISGMGMDLQGQTGSVLSYSTTGTAPNRVLTVQWKGYRQYDTVSTVNFQIVLHETTNAIDVNYGTNSNTGSTSAQVGIKAGSNTFNTDVNNRKSTTSWSATTRGTDNASTIAFNSTVVPPSGLRFTWTLLSACSGTPTAGTIALSAQNTCSGTTPAALLATGYSLVTGLTFQWEESNDNGVTDAWANAVGGSGATTDAYTPASFTGTTIYYRLKVTCTASGEFAYTNVSSVNPPASPVTAASAIVFSNITGSSMTINWTNGSGNRRYVVVNTTNTFTDPLATQTAAITGTSAYAGGQQIVYDGSGSSVTITGLSCNTTYYVRVFEYQRCGSAAPYTFYFNTATSATNPVSQTTAQPALAALPVFNNFAGYNGDNLATVLPGWYEATGATTTVVANSGWINSTAFTATTAKVNLFATSNNEYIISPRMVLNAASRLRFKAAITGYNSSAVDPERMQGTDDKVLVMVSTDGCGQVWTPIYTFSASNTTTLTNVLTDFELPLAAYTGQTIQIAFKAVDGPANDEPDYDFHIGNIVIENIPSCEAPSVASVSTYTFTSVTFSWTASISNPTGGYQYEIRSSGAAGSGATGLAATGTTAAGVLTATANTLAANTTYSIYVRSNCGDSNLSPWTVATTFYTGYCTPVSSGTATYISNFSTSSPFGTSNNTSVFSAGGYQDYSSTIGATGYAGGTVDFSLGFIGGSLGASVWVDWNNNLIFETSERVFDVGSYTTTTPQTGSIAIPAGTPNGVYRMRVAVDFNATSPNPCFNAARAEAEDYKLTVITQPTDAVDNATLQSFVSGTTPAAVTSIQTCQSVTVLAQVFEPGVTEAAGANAGVTVWIAYNTANTDPATWPASSWVRATYNANVGNNDEYKRTVTGLAAGTYYFASRVQLNGGPFRYGASNSGFYNATTNPNAALTVNAIPAIIAGTTDNSLCVGESTTLTVTSANANYTYSWMPGTLTGAAPVVNPTATTTYTVTATDAVSGCTTTGTVTIVVNPLPTALVVSPSPATACVGTVLPLSVTGGNALASGTVGNGTTLTGDSDEFSAFNNRRASLKSQTIYTAAELTAAGVQRGNLVSIAYNIATLGSSASNTNYTVKIGTTTNAVFTNGSYLSETGFTTVFGPANYTHAVGLNTITFTTPFVWDGTSNIVVSVSMRGIDSSSNAQTFYTDGAANSSIYNFNDLTAATGTTSSRKLNLRFNVTSQAAVTWSPIANLYSDAAATTPYVAGTAAGQVYFKSATAGSTAITATATSAAGCTSSSVVNVTVNSTPAPTATATQTFCNSGTVAGLTATGVTGAVINWYSAATGGTALAGTTALTNGGVYYASQTPAGQCESTTRTMVTATINTIAAPVVVSTTQTFCNSGTVAGLQATGTAGATIMWYSAATGGTALAGTTALTNGGVYYASQMVGTCESAARTMVTVTIDTPAAPVVANATQSFCNAATIANLQATGTAGATIMWYAAATGGTALAPTTALTNGGVYYASQMVGTCESAARTMVTATIGDIAAPVVSNTTQTFCNEGTVANLQATGTAGAMIMWYVNATGGTALAPTTALINGGVYYASQMVGTCESVNRTMVTATINTIAAPVVSNTTQTFCNEGTVANLQATGTAGAMIMWYANATGGTALAGTTALTNGGVYYASQMVGTCESTARTMVTATITTPAAPVVSTATPNICNAGTVADLQATGTAGATIMWYSAATGGTALAPTTALTNGGVYYASQMVGTCESAARTMVTVSISAPAAPVVSTATPVLCNAGTVADLQATGVAGAMIMWYADATGGTALAPTTALTNSGVYYASQMVGTCESTTRVMVTVTISNVPSPEVLIVQPTCAVATATITITTPTGAGYTYSLNGGATQESSTFSDLAPGTYTLTVQNASGCSAQTVVLLNAAPVIAAPTGQATQAITAGTAEEATIEDLVVNEADVVWYATSEDAANAANPLAAGTQLIDGEDYFATQTVDGCTSPAFRVVVSLTLGKETFNLTSIKYYPNPVTDKLTITYGSNITTVEVYDLLGRQVIAKEFNATTADINFAGLESATYIVRVSADGKSKEFKVVKN